MVDFIEFYCTVCGKDTRLGTDQFSLEVPHFMSPPKSVEERQDILTMLHMCSIDVKLGYFAGILETLEISLR